MNRAITAMSFGILALGCAGQHSENDEIVDNLIQAGFPSEDIQVVDNLVYVGRDGQVSLAASREMVASAASGKEQYRTTNTVNPTLRKICIEGSTYHGLFSDALDDAIANYNRLPLAFTIARTPSSNCDFTINATIETGSAGGVAEFPSNGLPGGVITIRTGLNSFNINTVEHVITHEIGHTLGFRHSDFFDRSISCGGTAVAEDGQGVGEIHIPGTPTGATVGGSIMNSCFRTVESGEFSASDRQALKTLYPRKSDILWRNIGSGAVTSWLMNDTSIASQAVLAGAGVVGLDWHTQGVGDFNDDGDSDILWRNNSGEVQLWLMNGVTIASATTVTAAGVVGLEWEIQGVADFNADNKADILWRNNSTTEVKLWLMNGAAIASVHTLAAAGVVEPEWQIQDVGDLNADKKSDILWRNNTTSEVKVWLMNGGTITTIRTVTGPGATELAWQIQGIGDFNDDTMGDIMWRNASGEVKLWIMTSGVFVSATTVTGPGVVGPEWQIESVGDFNGSGTSDLLWRNSDTGEVKIWLMNGAVIAAQGTVSGPGVVGLDWQIQGTGNFGQ